MKIIYEYVFYQKNTKDIISSRYIDQYICLKMKRDFNPHQYSSLYDSIIWFAISLFIEMDKNNLTQFTYDFLQNHYPFLNESEEYQNIFYLLEDILINKYDFFVQMKYE
jgi:hypothetical protein